MVMPSCHEAAAVRAEGHPHRAGTANLERGLLLSGVQVPDTHLAGVAGGDDASAIWAKMGLVDGQRVLQWSQDRLAGGWVPNQRHAVVPSRQDGSAIGAEFSSRHAIRMPHPGAE